MEAELKALEKAVVPFVQLFAEAEDSSTTLVDVVKEVPSHLKVYFKDMARTCDRC